MLPLVKKINIIALEKHRSEIIDLLHKTGFVHIEETAAEKERGVIDLTTLEYGLAGVKFSLDFLKRFEEKKGTLWERLTKTKISLTLPYLEKIGQEFYYQEIVKQCEDLESQLNEKTSKIEKLKENERVISQWQNLNLMLNGQYETAASRTIFGTVKSLNYPNLLKILNDKSELIVVRQVNEIDKEIYLVLTFAKKIESKIKEILNKYDLKLVDLPQTNDYPEKSLRNIDQQIATAKKEIQKITAEAKKLLKHQEKLKIVFDYLSWQLEKTAVQKKFSGTDSTFIILGWIVKDDLPRLEEKIGRISPAFEIVELPISKNETIPVVMKNTGLITPFEAVTNIYGLPQSHEPDPTPYLAPFFIVFFGLCLTDAGYGIILALFSWLAIKIMKVPKENQKLFRLMIYGGISTFVLGALFGGWFGIVLEEIPGPIGHFLRQLRLIDPAKEPIKVLLLTFVLGIIQVMTGIAIAAYWKIKNGNWLSALLDHGLWLYFIASLILWALAKQNILPGAWQGTGLWLVWAGLALLIFTQGRTSKNIIAKLLKGVLSLYSLVGYFADVLSYSRLLALGLGTGIIAMVVNLIAMLMKDALPYVGWLLAIIILIGGHLFNLAINVLGAFIHSGRLQFVEFFTKFMEGGGSRFKPFKQETKYISIKE